MGATERVKDARARDRAEREAARAGGIVTYDTPDVPATQSNPYGGPPQNIADLQRDIQALKMDVQNIHQALQKLGKGMPAFVAALRKYVDNQVDVLGDKLAAVGASEANLHETASSVQGDAMGALNALEPMLRAFIRFVNASDTVVNPLGLQLSAIAEGLGSQATTEGAKRLWSLASDFGQAWAYYDATVGLTSIFQATAAPASGDAAA